MGQVGTVLKHSRTDVQLTGPQQGVGTGLPANILFIYTGEVSCKFVSDSGTTLQDQLSIVLPDGTLSLGQIIGPPVPIIFPTSWNANDAFSVVAVNNPTLSQETGLLGGLVLTAEIAVQNAMLLNVQYQVSILARL
jgi:hypothetical protein